MRADRRSFLKIAGLAVLGVSLKPAVSALAGPEAAPLNLPRPLAQPQASTAQGRQWAMVINLSKCEEGCTDCIAACNAAHNVPAFGDPKQEVKWTWTEDYHNAFGHDHDFISASTAKQPVLVMCNHCENPACVRVCPTQATFKRADGIVMMDYHRCIGCRFCMAACPYGSRSFNWVDPRLGLDPNNLNPDYPTRSRGVVEKCNFCEERLAKGLEPACVEACEAKAIVFGDLADPKSVVRQLLAERYSVVRKPYLGTKPKVYYTV